MQVNEGFNLANKLHVDHVVWQRHKMKVKLAAQTLSLSVADALNFLENDVRHADFQNCSSTIEFIRNIDRLFDFLNSRHKLMRGFKQPINLSNFEYFKSNIVEIADYLLNLQDLTGQRLIYHRRKTFILGFVATAKSVLSLAAELLNREVMPYNYFLTYKVSQDHIELLFSCVRSRGGFNNNPNAIQFKTAMKQILLKNSIMSSNRSNVLCFESQSIGSLFSLKWTKRRTPICELSEDEVSHANEDADVQHIFDNNVSKVTENVLYYISGFLVRGIVKDIDCQECSEALLSPINDHQYCYLPYDSLVNRKNRGGLIHSSYGVYKVVFTCEKSFKVNVINNDKNISLKSNLIQRMMYEVVSSCDWSHYFPLISDHRFHIDAGFEDDHLTQIVKRISNKYLTMRLHTYGKRYTREIVNKDSPSVRHQLTKLILFKNI